MFDSIEQVLSVIMPSTATKHGSKVNLDDIVNISEDEFKRQIAIWIDERGVSKALQSKLRADLFEHFNRTNLGRQIALKHHQNAHRLMLSPLLLALNTLVAEFLYSEDCHFSLSVFATEVPFRNALPDFESAAQSVFRFSDPELNAIFEAIKCSKSQHESIVRKLYVDKDEMAMATNTSLLYCIFRGLIDARSNGKATSTTNLSRDTHLSASHQSPAAAASAPGLNAAATADNRQAHQSPPCSTCNKNDPDKLQINTRYFKYLNRYLDILSDRVHEMSESLARIGQRTASAAQPTTTSNSQQLEQSIKSSINKMQEHLADMSKSKKKHKKLQDIINSVEKLSTNLEKCSDNMHNLYVATKTAASNGQSHRIIKPTDDTISPNPLPSADAQDYSIWLHDMKTSVNGKRFIARMETSLQKTLDREKDHLQKLFDEKMENYRVLIKLHYKQKYSTMQANAPKEPVPRDPSTAGRLNANSNSTPVKPIASILKDAMQQSALSETEKQMVHAKRNEKERHVENIVATAKYTQFILFICLFFPFISTKLPLTLSGAHQSNNLLSNFITGND